MPSAQVTVTFASMTLMVSSPIWDRNEPSSRRAITGRRRETVSTSTTVTQFVTKTPCTSLAGCNLSGLNLSGARLAGANLTGANLNGANLTGASLSGANLSGANLNGATLTGASLSGATVTGTNFNKVTWSNTTCPDGTNSNADGGTCTSHL